MTKLIDASRNVAKSALERNSTGKPIVRLVL